MSSANKCLSQNDEGEAEIEAETKMAITFVAISIIKTGVFGVERGGFWGEIITPQEGKGEMR